MSLCFANDLINTLVFVIQDESLYIACILFQEYERHSKQVAHVNLHIILSLSII